MKTRLGLLALSIAALAGCEQTPPITEAGIQREVSAATITAGSDLKSLLDLCKPAPAVRPKVTDADLAALIAKPAPPPGRAFDNLYFLGDAWVSAWAINTRDGIILLDTLNDGKEAARLIEGGLRRVGLNPARIKYIIVTHGHGDHYGGVAYLSGKYKDARIVMGEPDWAMLSSDKIDFETPLWDAMPKFRPGVDVSAKDGDTVTLGGTTVTLYMTAGHTLGTISPVFDVTWRGETHRVVEWGGTGFNFGADKTRFEAYVASTERMRKLAGDLSIDVMISNHPNIDSAPAKLEQMRKAPRGANPFVQSTGTVQRAMTVMNDCAQSQRDRFIMQGVYK